MPMHNQNGAIEGKNKFPATRSINLGAMTLLRHAQVRTYIGEDMKKIYESVPIGIFDLDKIITCLCFLSILGLG